MIEEKEPLYFKEFRNLVIERFDKLEVKIEKEVESLALSTANQFKRIDERFDKVDERFDGLENRVERVEDKLGRVEIRLEGVENSCDGLVHNVAEVKKSIETIERHIGRYEGRATNFEAILLQDIRPRLVALEKLA